MRSTVGGKSFFYSSTRVMVRKIISDVLAQPDVVERHRWCVKKSVYKKKFRSPIGQDGLSGIPCHTVMVVFDNHKRDIVTAYPIL